jgi:two-component system sensor histidine kinase KdpD
MTDCEFTQGSSWGGRHVARRVADASARGRVVVTGTVRSAETITIDGSPSYRCAIDDGTGELDVLFVGRSSVAGVRVGARCRVEGTAQPGRTVLWNPLYRLEVGADGEEVARRGPPLDGPAALEPGASRDVGNANVMAGTRGQDVPEAVPGSGVLGQVGAMGSLRIYLGAAPGVGKTVAMLDEGQRRYQRGTDVVIGFVESHGRPVTEARAQGLEVVPRLSVERRGASFEELDLDAVLKRHPQVVLIDELAHTNVVGSGRHDKRWEDVLELLEAGIDVVTTLNVQHLDSMAGTVERVTGVLVRERVPDWVVRRADQIELVDSSPEQLRRRMSHGNIYPSDKVPQALANFFRADNLSTLRELTLCFVADDTEDKLLEHLQVCPAHMMRGASEKVMVGVAAGPGSHDVIRRAATMAATFNSELYAVHVSSGGAGRRHSEDELAELRKLAAEVGANWLEAAGDDIVDTLAAFARRHQVTQIVIGAGRRSPWQDLKGGGSIVKRLNRLAVSGGVDVHVIGRRAAPTV